MGFHWPEVKAGFEFKPRLEDAVYAWKVYEFVYVDLEQIVLQTLEAEQLCLISCNFDLCQKKYL